MDQRSTITEMAPHVAAHVPHDGVGFREFVAMVAALMALMALGIDTMLPALPQIGTALGVASENERQLIVTVYILGFGVAQLIYGPLSDRFGRRPILLGGIVGYAICAIGIAMAPTFGILLALRVLQGVSIAATRVVTTSVVRDCYNGRQMARVMSLALIVFLAVPVLAPSIGQVAMLVMPWRGLFVALAVIAVGTFVWVGLRLPETLHPDYRRTIRPDVVFSGMLTAITTRVAVGYMLVQAFLQAALLGFIASVQQIFADVFHDAAIMPIVFAGIASAMGFASLLNARIVERVGTRRVSHAALLGFIAIETIHLAITLAGHETMASFAICQAIAMFAFGLAMGNFGAMAIEPLGALAGTAASVQGFVMLTGGSIGGALIGQAFDGTTIPMTLGFVGAGVVGLVIVLVTERGRLFRPQSGD